MDRLDRRDFVRCAAATAVGASLPFVSSVARAEGPADGCTLSIGTYAMPGMRVEEAVRVIADTGYDGVELAVRKDFDGAAATMPPKRRRAVRRLLDESGLRLTAVMEHLQPSEDDSEHAAQLEQLKQDARLARDLAPGEKLLLQTTLGSGDWTEKRDLFLDRVGDWVEVLRAAGVVLAIKPHRGGGMSRPDEAVWLIGQLGDTPWLRMVYDYSHYAFRDMTVEDTVATALPYTAHIAVKDAVQQGDRIVFQLPGASGTFDYAHLMRLFYQGGYRADFCCEVSSMVSKAANYDPVRAVEICYRNMAQAMEEASIPRPPRA